MANANASINITNLDFDEIKSSLKNYLSQDSSPFADYNFEGSVLSTVLDVLARNTYYNGFYLNMVANEMFLDTAIKRSSVISHAKLLNYTPKSCKCSVAVVNLIFSSSDPTFLLPKYTLFQSQAYDGINYNFTTLDSIEVPVVAGKATFNNIYLYQGQPVSFTFPVNTITNPSLIFKLPDDSIDTSTLHIIVKSSSGSLDFDTYILADSLLSLTPTSLVYFLQESLDGYYEIQFGDGVLGKKLSTGNVIIVEYLTTNKIGKDGISNFTLMSTLSSQYTSTPKITTVQASSGGLSKESISQIKFHAPKHFSSQNRAVSKEDYITAIQQNDFGYPFDAVNVWGGEEHDPKVYGKVFICLKPAGAYILTDTQKQRLLNDVIKPISIMTVQPEILDPDYVFITINANVLYDQKKTTLTTLTLQNQIKTVIQNFTSSTLNTFNSTFMASELNVSILNSDISVITNEVSLKVQKKFYPNFSIPSSYTLNFGMPLKKGLFSENISSSPSLHFLDTVDQTTIIKNVHLEEVPMETIGVESIKIVNPGFGYSITPTVIITGDGVGATANAVLSSTGTLKSIEVTNPGYGYSSATAKIVANSQDKSGKLGSVNVILEGRYGTIRSYYYTPNHVKVILNANAGTVDYLKGIITLNSFNPVDSDDTAFGSLTISAVPESTIFSSTYNRIITVDPSDQNAVIVTAKSK